MLENKKKIIIIGAGISGLTAGIYALENGYDVEIYEKHNISGGQCTGWTRKGCFIDGCAHWVVGTNPRSQLYPLWAHVGAFDLNSNIHETEFFSKFDIDGEVITIYADLDKLEKEFLRIAPEDKRMIRSFINGIKAYKYVKIPVNKPLDTMNIFQFLSFGISMLPMALKFMFYKHISGKEYASKFKSEKLRKVFSRIISDEYNIHSLFYILQALASKDAGLPEGGSRQFALNIENKFRSLGGKIYFNKEVDHILIENDKACGIALKDGQTFESDFVIASSDMYHTLTKLLNNSYEDKYYQERFDNIKDYPVINAFLYSYKIHKDVSTLPKMINFEIPALDLCGYQIKDITVRNHSFDQIICKDITTFTVLVNVNDKVYDALKTMNKEDYKEIKSSSSSKIRNYIMKYFNLQEEDIEFLDVATPLTYERYTNGYKGSYMSFLTTCKAKGLMRKGLINGLDNFVLAGQWLMSPGGLPIALFTGKHAAMRICKMDKKKFIDLDYLYKVRKLVNEAQTI